MRPLALFLLIITCVACDSDPPAIVESTPSSTQPALPRVRAQRVTPLPAGRLTHLAPDNASHLFWIQESEQAGAPLAQPGRQVLFAMNEGAAPAATRISNDSILSAIGRGGATDATGQIQSLAFGADGKLYFYFLGGTRREILAALGTFTPGTDEVRIIADTSRLKTESGMGDSIGLARGTLIRSGDLVWLWLRHQDGFIFLTLDTRRFNSTLKQPFERLTGERAANLRLTASSEDLTGASTGLLYLDRKSATIWKIDAKGLASMAANVADLPTGISAPVSDGRGRLITLAPAGRPFNKPEPADEVAALLERSATGPAIQYPALVIIDGLQRTTLGRDTWEIAPGLNLASWAPPRLFIDRGHLLAYDPAAGELIRLRMD